MDSFPFRNALSGFLFEEVPTPEPSIGRDNGEIIEWKTVMEKILREFFAELVQKPQLSEKFMSRKDDTSFFVCLLSNVTVKKAMVEYVAKCKQQIRMGTSGKKNSTTAASIRLLGNQHFVKKEYRAAFKTYTQGLMFVRDEDKGASLLYANRSAVYFYMEQYENALEDIERAFKFGYNHNYDKIKPIGKLLIRKGFSLLALGRDDQVKELLDANLPTNEDEPDFSQWQQLKKQSENVNDKITKRDITLSQFQDISTIRSALINKDVFRPHKRFPWLNAKVDLRFDAVKGYSLVSKEEMEYGEIVALSKPFVSLDPKRDSNERCHYCMVPCFETPKYFSDKPNAWNDSMLSSDSLRMATPLACSECSNVLYCSDACRTAAWTAYHRFECSQMTILAKMDSKAHLALRMLYMMGSLESADQKIVTNWETIEDHLESMVNQEAYSSIYLNPHAKLRVEKQLQMILTICIHLKLLQMSNFLPDQSGNTLGYLEQASTAYVFLLQHLEQVEVIESVPFTDQTTSRTIKPRPFLSVDGMMAIMKHSCEATVGPSSLLTESFGSTVKLLFAKGVVSAGTVLTLAYDTQEIVHFEALKNLNVQLNQQFSNECACSRCLRESRDSLDHSNGVYYPIGCTLCGSLMVRTGGDDSYRCSSKEDCNFKYSPRQMKNVYERVGKMMSVKKQLIRDEQIISQPTGGLECKVDQLKRAIEETASLFYGPSPFLPTLYAQLAECYLRLTGTVTPAFEQLPANVPPEAKYVYSPHLASTLLVTGKALDLLQGRNLGPCATDCLIAARLIEKVLPVVQSALSYCTSSSQENELGELVDSLVSAKVRYEALLKMTAFDTMVASSLREQE